MITAAEAIAVVIKIEGGYVNDPDDAGGETKYGISKRSYPDVDIRGLTKTAAAAIYLDDYWYPLRCENVPGVLALPLLDSGVNQGRRTAVRLLQGVLGVKVDGLIGPKTLAAVNEYPSISLLSAEFTLARLDRYVNKSIGRKSQRKYLPSWVHRSVLTHKLTRRP